MSLPVPPANLPLRLTPTDVSQFVRLEQCERYLAIMAALPLKPDAPLIVVGDHRQMPPIVKHDWEAEARRTLAAKPELELILAEFDDAGIASVTVTDDWSVYDLPDEGWKEDDSSARFIQFSFEKDWFCLDMPLQTLYRAEAEQILRCRKGFFYLRDRPQFALYKEDVEGYDPFRKVYIFGDEESAAEDMAFIFFQVWRFPVDWRFYVKAAAFGDKKAEWEDGAPLE